MEIPGLRTNLVFETDGYCFQNKASQPATQPNSQPACPLPASQLAGYRPAKQPNSVQPLILTSAICSPVRPAAPPSLPSQ